MSTDLRAQHVRRTRELIHHAAIDLATERGYSAMTVDDVAERAGVSRRTVFNHFPTKSDLIITGPNPLDSEVLARFASGENPDLTGALEELLRESIRDIQGRGRGPADMRATFRLVQQTPELQPIVHERLRAYAECIREATCQRLGAQPDDLRVSLIVNSVVMAQRSALDLWASAQGVECSACGSHVYTDPHDPRTRVNITDLNEALSRVVQTLVELFVPTQMVADSSSSSAVAPAITGESAPTL